MVVEAQGSYTYIYIQKKTRKPYRDCIFEMLSLATVAFHEIR